VTSVLGDEAVAGKEETCENKQVSRRAEGSDGWRLGGTQPK
jgi:hypothetical protein